MCFRRCLSYVTEVSPDVTHATTYRQMRPIAFITSYLRIMVPVLLQRRVVHSLTCTCTTMAQQFASLGIEFPHQGLCAVRVWKLCGITPTYRAVVSRMRILLLSSHGLRDSETALQHPSLT